MCIRDRYMGEKLKDPTFYLYEILRRVKPEEMKTLYGIESWDDEEHFLSQVAEKQGKLLKGGEPDISTVAKMVIHDWQRGRIPYFTLPPNEKETTNEESKEDNKAEN
eukprot:TRINITY_DN3423_c0_g1_i4.p1 TRINITY_DN3423_c0_g1~~TRINITY_DN3423_c0_g1_i4.p1  ORF type:complete len:107 (-),score=47.52 TRINITY_DN3423_c0_g1_i4:108-428(-)